MANDVKFTLGDKKFHRLTKNERYWYCVCWL